MNLTNQDTESKAKIVDAGIAASKPKAKIQRNPWVCPPAGTVNLNVDAVLIILEKNDASGVVLHDNHGRQATAL